MAFAKTSNKMKAIRAFINTWLKDVTWYCNHCGQNFDAKLFEHESCCDNPQIGRNRDHTMGLVNQNKRLQEDRLNDFASNETKTMRWGISIPPRLMSDLERYFKVNYEEKLFNNIGELRQFMQEFPQFRVAKKI